MNLAILGQRRVGKTSLIKNVMAGVQDDEKIIPIYIDCLSMPTLRRLARVISEDAKASYIEKTNDTKYVSKINDMLNKSVSELLQKMSGVDISISSYISLRLSLQEEKTDEQTVFENALNYLEYLGSSKDVRFVVFLDEFSEIAERWGNDFVKLLRTIVQQQTKIMYVFSSSAITFMHDLVYSNESPFYRQLKTIPIKTLPQKDANTFIIERLETVGYSINKEALAKILELTNCLPDYIQRMGDILLDIAENKTIDQTDVENAYENIFLTLDPTFNMIFTRLTDYSKIYSNILVSIAILDKPSAIAKDVGIPTSSLYYYLPHLINLGIIEKVQKGQYMISDPIFREWIINKFRLDSET